MLKCLKALLLRLYGLRGLHREVREAYGQVGSMLAGWLPRLGVRVFCMGAA